MGRPKGSRNKEKQWEPKENPPEPVASAEKQQSKESKRRTHSTTDSLPETEDTSCGQSSAESASEKEQPEKRLHSGWINIQKYHMTRAHKTYTSFFTGGDIHESKESAKNAASKSTVTQVYIEFEENQK